jgi:hypothetical protein
MTEALDALRSRLDTTRARGAAWQEAGADSVVAEASRNLREKYGTDDITKFRYVAADVPGGYMLDWDGKQKATGFLSAIRLGARSTGLVAGAGAGDASDGSPMTLGNASIALGFGADWRGKGGTIFNLYRQKDNSVGWFTSPANSNDTADAVMAIATVAGGMALGSALSAGMASGAAAGSATAAGTATAGGSATAAGTATVSGSSVAATLGTAKSVISVGSTIAGLVGAGGGGGGGGSPRGSAGYAISPGGSAPSIAFIQAPGAAAADPGGAGNAAEKPQQIIASESRTSPQVWMIGISVFGLLALAVISRKGKK